MSELSNEEYFVRELRHWGRANARAFPWRTESDPFRVLVAELLLQRSRAKTVAKVYRRLFDRWPSPSDLAAAQLKSIASVIRPLGLVGRATKLKLLARRIVELGGVPVDADALQQLPGVGRYAANATIVAAFGRPAPVVDGVTARVYKRYFALDSDAAPVADRRLWELVSAVSPKRGARDWNWAVLDFASALCVPKLPRCADCPLRGRCSYARSTSVVGGER